MKVMVSKCAKSFDIVLFKFLLAQKRYPKVFSLSIRFFRYFHQLPLAQLRVPTAVIGHCSELPEEIIIG